MNTYEFCADWVRQHAGRASRVLDYGCGAGQIVALLRGRGVDAYGCDVFYEGGDYSRDVAPELAPYVSRMAGNDIPFESASFDIVLSNQVFEHVPDIDTAAAEIARVLKPGGMALNVFPDRGVWREGHCGVPFLHRFPKGSAARVYYAALLRALGIGLHKQGKPVMQWARDFCTWLDQWTYYRSRRDIHAAFGRHFGRTSHYEELWFDARLGRRFRFLPVWLRRLIVRKLAGLTLVSTEPRAA